MYTFLYPLGKREGLLQSVTGSCDREKYQSMPGILEIYNSGNFVPRYTNFVLRYTNRTGILKSRGLYTNESA
jgi:hypothetical protein